MRTKCSYSQPYFVTQRARFLLYAALAAAALCLFFGARSALAAPLRVMYIERPPFYYTKDGVALGFMVDTARQAFAAAGVEVVFESSTAQRILQDMQPLDGYCCAVGWIQTPERDAYARFSLPIYTSKPLAALALRGNGSRFLTKKSLQALAADKNLRIGVAEGFSYGETMDRLLQQFLPQRFTVPGDQQQLVRLLQQNAFEYILIAPEEIEYLLRDSGLAADDFLLVPLTDTPSGNLGRIMCSRDVDLTIMERIDEALRTLDSVRAP